MGLEYVCYFKIRKSCLEAGPTYSQRHIASRAQNALIWSLIIFTIPFDAVVKRSFDISNDFQDNGMFQKISGDAHNLPTEVSTDGYEQFADKRSTIC